MHTALTIARSGHTVVATMRNLDKTPCARRRKPKASTSANLMSTRGLRGCLRAGRMGLRVHRRAHQHAGHGYIRSLEQTPMEEVQALFDVNFYGVVRCTRAVLPGRREQKSGHVFPISSVGGLVGQPMNEYYCACKFALEGLMKSLASYAQPFFGVRVAIIEPAGIATEFVNRVMSDVQQSRKIFNDAYAPMLGAYQRQMSQPECTSRTQAPQQVADVVRTCVEAERPHLRYPTSARARAFTRFKLYADETGDRGLAF
ncbi:MAG: SDR family NAD(P)-dependent oxidoreductase, partial [Sphingobacteriaceae bacterium]|nr:SDR family NAD(P)-dependent oxidoreductase [Cytophagaceae bacterium]